MMNYKKPIILLLALVLLLTPLFAYGEQAEIAADIPAEEAIEEAAEETIEEPAEEAAPEATDETAAQPAEEAPAYSYSEGIDANGFWDGLKALDYVTLNDDMVISIPSETHTIADDAVQGQIDTILSSFTTSLQITDRALQDGDTVNIDYVGSVDGVEFDGGSTGGAGTDVTIGVTSYIDDFLQQLIGHNPGETMDVNVTFPEDYGVEELNGKDALFVTTINYITESLTPEMTDAFVEENLADYYKCSTVVDLTEAVRQELKDAAIQAYIEGQITSIATINTLPDSIYDYQEKAMINYYETYAGYYGMDLESFVQGYVGLESVDALIETNHENNIEMANFYLAVQAIAEQVGITVEDKDVADYFLTRFNEADYSAYESEYGMPYLKQSVLCTLVLDHLIKNAVLA